LVAVVVGSDDRRTDATYSWSDTQTLVSSFVYQPFRPNIDATISVETVSIWYFQ